MEAKLESLYSNQVSKFVEAPKGIKPIRCKSVYKRKREVYGKVETFKARVVIKDYGQKLGFNYEEAFSLVAILKSIKEMSRWKG